MWWILIQKYWYDYHGDFDYLKKQKQYMIGLLDQLSTFIDENNSEVLDGVRFLDWPTSEKPKAVHAGLQSMMIMTFEAGSEIMKLYDLKDLQIKYSKIADRLKKHQPKGNTTKQAAALMSLAGLADAKKNDKDILSQNGVNGMSTFYGYYILKAMAKAEDYTGALNVIRDYWGGMLDLGATTFWEDFDIKDKENSSRIDELTPKNKFDIHGDFGEYCYVGYRHSLCHGWASGPTSWLSQYVLGINVLDGGDTINLDPHLGDLEFVEGTFPTKYGVFKVNHKKGEHGKIMTLFETPKNIKGIQK